MVINFETQTMIANESNLQKRKLARITGFFYLLIIACGLMSGIFVREALIDPSDSQVTLNNLIENEYLYRLGFLGDMVMVISDVVVSVLFYFLLKEVHRGLAIFAAVFRLMQSAILGANLINLFEPVLMIRGAQQLSTEQLYVLAEQVLTQFQVFDHGYLISGVFFGINCLLMGILLFHSMDFPKFLGVMLFTAGLGYLFNSMSNFVAPSLVEPSEIVMFFTAVLAEVTFCVYLLVWGVRKPKAGIDS